MIGSCTLYTLCSLGNFFLWNIFIFKRWWKYWYRRYISFIIIIIIIILDSDAIFKVSEGQAAKQNAEMAGFYVDYAIDQLYVSARLIA